MGYDNDSNSYNNLFSNNIYNTTDGDYFYQSHSHDNSSDSGSSSSSSSGDDSDYSSGSTYYDYGTPVVATLSFFLVVSMILALVGNVMVIMTIVRHRGMRTRTNMLLGNLAVADILVAVLDMPIALITIVNHDWVFSQTFCVLNGFAVGLGLMLSVHTLMWISIHKFLSITRPFARNVTQFQIVLMMLFIWTWTILYNLTATPLIGMTQTVYKKGASQCGPVIPTEPWERLHSGINTVCNLVVPMAVMVCCYYKIFKEVKDHLERMRDFADVGMRNSLIQQKQITETLCIVLLMFFLFWLPYIGYSMSLVFCGETCVPFVFNPISYLCGYMNSACNPIIYALRSPSFRRGFKEIIFGTPTHLPGSVRLQGGILESFKRTTFRRSEKGPRIRGKENGAQHPTTHPARHTPDHTPLPLLEMSVSTCDPPVPPGANGDLQQVEVKRAEVDFEGHEERITEKVLFEVGSHTQLDLPSSPSPAPNTDYNLLPWQPLQVHEDTRSKTDAHLSRSCQQIVSCTSSVITRSASAGEILDSSHHHHDSPTVPCEKHVEHTAEPPKRRHFSEVHRPLMWQASVDHLTNSPVGRKRRRPGEGRSSQQPQLTHLGVRKLLCSLQRSFTDLFNIDEQQKHSEP